MTEQQDQPVIQELLWTIKFTSHLVLDTAANNVVVLTPVVITGQYELTVRMLGGAEFVRIFDTLNEAMLEHLTRVRMLLHMGRGDAMVFDATHWRSPHTSMILPWDKSGAPSF